eukprot:scaffold4147_cov412-Prasinococcus_capsulatus_cf.AAC.3
MQAGSGSAPSATEEEMSLLGSSGGIAEAETPRAQRGPSAVARVKVGFRAALSSVWRNATIRLLLEERKLQLLIPYNAAFGLVNALFGFYVNSKIVADLHGEGELLDGGNAWRVVAYSLARLSIPLVLLAVLSLSGAVGAFGVVMQVTALVMAAPLTRLSNLPSLGRKLVMSLGSVAYTVLLVLLLTLTNGPAFESSFLVGFIFFLCGFGNCVWQGCCAAVHSDFFTNNPAPAFANLKLWSGLASAFAFFVFPSLEDAVLVPMCLSVVLLGLVCYLQADRLASASLAADGAARETPPIARSIGPDSPEIRQIPGQYCPFWPLWGPSKARRGRPRNTLSGARRWARSARFVHGAAAQGVAEQARLPGPSPPRRAPFGRFWAPFGLDRGPDEPARAARPGPRRPALGALWGRFWGAFGALLGLWRAPERRWPALGGR